MSPTTPTQTPLLGEATLDTRLIGLCDAYGLDAVGQSLARQHGRTRAIAAVLGQLQDADPNVSLPTPIVIGITARSHPDIWQTLQPPQQG